MKHDKKNAISQKLSTLMNALSSIRGHLTKSLPFSIRLAVLLLVMPLLVMLTFINYRNNK